MISRIFPHKSEIGPILIAIGAVLILAVLVTGVVRIGQRFVSLKSHAEGLRALAESGQFGPDSLSSVRYHTVGVRDDLLGLRAELGLCRLLCPQLGWVPVVGGDLRAAPDLLDMALLAADGGALLVENESPLVQSDAAASQSTRGGKQAVTRLVAAGPYLATARNQLETASELRERVDVNDLSERRAGQVADFDRYLGLMQAGVDGALVASRVLGRGGTHSYLVLVQNDDELRATGGLVSGVVLVTFDDGTIVGLSVADSYQLDDFSKPYPEPPTPIRDYMAADLWLFRDANWSPDFPTAAQAAESLYTWGGGREVDGVVALDQQGMQLMISALGPLQIGESGEPVTADNLQDFVRQSWTPGTGELQNTEWWEHRKDFMTVLMGAVVDKLQRDPQSVDFVALSQAVLEGLEHRHIQVYLHDPVAAQVLMEQGWDGSLRDTSGDYLMVVDTNMGFNKVNPNVGQEINYTVDLTNPAQPRGELSVVYANHSAPEDSCRQEARYGNGYDDLVNRCYWDYARVFLPAGSQLLSASPAPLPDGSLLHTFRGVEGRPDTVVREPGENGTTMLGSFFVVPGGEKYRAEFEYSLPPTVVVADGKAHNYQLLVQKQAGSHELPLTVRVILPPGAQVLTSQPDPTVVGSGQLEYDLSLATDQQLDLEYR